MCLTLLKGLPPVSVSLPPSLSIKSIAYCQDLYLALSARKHVTSFFCHCLSRHLSISFGCIAGGGPGGPAGVAAGPGGAQMNAQMMEEMSKRLSDPATADLLSAFVQSMKAEDLASMLKQSGMDVSTQQVNTLC